MRVILHIALAAIISGAFSTANAQAYPNRPIRLVVPFAPGGTTEVLARLLGQQMGEHLGQQIVVDTRPGASGGLGTAIAAKSAPDGHTLLFTSLSPIVINVSVQEAKLPYDPQKDLAPISLITKVPSVLTVSADSAPRTVKDFIAFARKSGKLTYGSSGAGGVNHLIGELFKSAAGIDLLHVPYKGAGPSLIALRSKEVFSIIAAPPAVLPHTRSGVFRALAVSSAKRSPALPDTPTLIESGMAGFDVTAWYALMAPAGTPRPIINRIHAALTKTITTSPVAERLVAEGAAPEPTTPEEFAQLIAADLKNWAKAVEIAGLKKN
jgi:tripartite-type tricarboxylate transporter receptor subunit TctC